MFFDPIKRLDLLDLRHHLVIGLGLRAFDGQDHLVLVGVLQRDEFKYLGVIPGRVQQQGAQAVCQHFCLLAQMDAVLQDGAQGVRAQQLRPDLLVAAGRAHDDLGARSDAQVNGVVGRNVTGMQSDHHVQVCGLVVAHIALFVAHALQAELVDDLAAQLDQVVTQLHARDFGLLAQHVLQVVVNGKGQITFARAKVDHMNGVRLRQWRPRQRGIKHFDELVDLLPLAGHGWDQMPTGIGDTQFTQKGAAQFQEAVLLAVMALAGVHRRGFVTAFNLANANAGLAFFAEGQLHFLCGRVQVSIAKTIRARQIQNRLYALWHQQVLGDVLGLMAVDKGQMGLLFEHHRTCGHPLQSRLLTVVVGQHHFDQGSLLQGLVDQGAKAFNRGGVLLHRAALCHPRPNCCAIPANELPPALPLSQLIAALRVLPCSGHASSKL